MTVTIRRWGNSLAIKLPKPLAEEAMLTIGSQVEIERTPQGLLIKPATKRPHDTLKELLAQCKGKTSPPEVEWDCAEDRI